MLSVVVPCYNEQEALPQLFERLSHVAGAWVEPYEVILVDDGSADDTWHRIRGFNSRDGRWKGIRLGRNFGQQIAISAGMRHARGDAVIVMDADLQDSPELVHEFIAKWREGYDVVYAIRARRGEGLLKRAVYKVFYRILNRIADTPIPLDAGDFSLMDRKVIDQINTMPEHSRFLRGMRAWVGFRQIGIAHQRPTRAAGEVKYTFRKLLTLAFDGFAAFSTAPLRLAMYMGFFVSFLALVGAAFTIVQRIFVEWFTEIGFPFVPGFYATFTAMMFLGGVQLICIGIIGEYLGRIYQEVKQRPLWTIREICGFNDGSGT